MAKDKQVEVQHGSGRFIVRNGLSGKLDALADQAEDELERMLKQEVQQQYDELKQAWPKPPSKWVYRRSGDEVKRKWLKRTGKSEDGFYMRRDPRGDDVYYTIQNDHVGRDGYSYVWVVQTMDLDMDGRKGKQTRAWHHFRDRATIAVSTKLVREAPKLIKKAFKNG